MTETIISIKDLSYSYPAISLNQQAGTVLKKIDLSIKRGEFVSVMGPTGTGKSTLCLAMNGIVPHSTGGIFDGDVTVCGKNTRNHKIPEIAVHVGVVFQNPETQLFTMSVEDEVAFGLESLGVDRDEMEERVTHALKLAGVEDMRKRSPFHLSGGQKQRVAIAAILAMEPEVLILDEPTSGLDPIGKQEVFRIIDDLRKSSKQTIIMVEHESEQIALFSDRVIVMDNGQVVMEGSPKEIFSEVLRMQEIGISIPQVTELAAGHSQRRPASKGPIPITLEEALQWF